MFDEEERTIYQVRLQAIAEVESKIASAIDKGLEQGLEQGIAKGKELGRELGRQEGRGQGIEEGKLKAAQAIAQGMLAKGLDTAMIAELTGLMVADVEALTSAKAPFSDNGT